MQKLLLIAILSAGFSCVELNGMDYKFEKTIKECDNSKDPDNCYKEKIITAFFNLKKRRGFVLDDKRLLEVVTEDIERDLKNGVAPKKLFLNIEEFNILIKKDKINQAIQK